MNEQELWISELKYELVSTLTTHSEKDLHTTVQRLFAHGKTYFSVKIIDPVNKEEQVATIEILPDSFLIHVVYQNIIKLALPPVTKAKFSVKDYCLLQIDLPKEYNSYLQSDQGNMIGKENQKNELKFNIKFPNIWKALIFSHVIRMYSWYCNCNTPESVPLNGTILGSQPEIDCIVSHCIKRGEAKFKMILQDNKERLHDTLLMLNKNVFSILVEGQLEPLLFKLNYSAISPIINQQESTRIILNISVPEMKRKLNLNARSKGEALIFVQCFKAFMESKIEQSLGSQNYQSQQKSFYKLSHILTIQKMTCSLFTFPKVNDGYNFQSSITIQREVLTSYQNETKNRKNFLIANFNYLGKPFLINRQYPQIYYSNLLIDQRIRKEKERLYNKIQNIFNNQKAIFDLLIVSTNVWNNNKKNNNHNDNNNINDNDNVINNNSDDSENDKVETEDKNQLKIFPDHYEIISKDQNYQDKYSKKLLLILHPLLQTVFMLKIENTDKYFIFATKNNKERDLICNSFIIFKILFFFKKNKKKNRDKKFNIKSYIEINSNLRKVKKKSLIKQKISSSKKKSKNSKGKKKEDKSKKKKRNLNEDDDQDEEIDELDINNKDTENDDDDDDDLGNTKTKKIQHKETFEKDYDQNYFDLLYYNSKFVDNSQFSIDPNEEKFDLKSDFDENERLNKLDNVETFRDLSLYSPKKSTYVLTLYNSFGFPEKLIQINLFENYFSLNFNNIKIYRKYSIYSRSFFMDSTSLIARFNIDEYNMIFIGFKSFEQRVGFILDFELKKSLILKNENEKDNENENENDEDDEDDENENLNISNLRNSKELLYECKVCLKGSGNRISARAIIENDFFNIQTKYHLYTSEYHEWTKCIKLKRLKHVASIEIGNQYSIYLAFKTFNLRNKFVEFFFKQRKQFLDKMKKKKIFQDRFNFKCISYLNLTNEFIKKSKNLNKKEKKKKKKKKKRKEKEKENNGGNNINRWGNCLICFKNNKIIIIDDKKALNTFHLKRSKLIKIGKKKRRERENVDKHLEELKEKEKFYYLFRLQFLNGEYLIIKVPTLDSLKAFNDSFLYYQKESLNLTQEVDFYNSFQIELNSNNYILHLNFYEIKIQSITQDNNILFRDFINKIELLKSNKAPTKIKIIYNSKKHYLITFENESLRNEFVLIFDNLLTYNKIENKITPRKQYLITRFQFQNEKEVNNDNGNLIIIDKKIIIQIFEKNQIIENNFKINSIKIESKDDDENNKNMITIDIENDFTTCIKFKNSKNKENFLSMIEKNQSKKRRNKNNDEEPITINKRNKNKKNTKKLKNVKNDKVKVKGKGKRKGNDKKKKKQKKKDQKKDLEAKKKENKNLKNKKMLPFMRRESMMPDENQDFSATQLNSSLKSINTIIGKIEKDTLHLSTPDNQIYKLKLNEITIKKNKNSDTIIMISTISNSDQEINLEFDNMNDINNLINSVQDYKLNSTSLEKSSKPNKKSNEKKKDKKGKDNNLNKSKFKFTTVTNLSKGSEKEKEKENGSIEISKSDQIIILINDKEYNFKPHQRINFAKSTEDPKCARITIDNNNFTIRLKTKKDRFILESQIRKLILKYTKLKSDDSYSSSDSGSGSGSGSGSSPYSDTDQNSNSGSEDDSNEESDEPKKNSDQSEKSKSEKSSESEKEKFENEQSEQDKKKEKDKNGKKSKSENSGESDKEKSENKQSEKDEKSEKSDQDEKSKSEKSSESEKEKFENEQSEKDKKKEKVQNTKKSKSDNSGESDKEKSENEQTEQDKLEENIEYQISKETNIKAKLLININKSQIKIKTDKKTLLNSPIDLNFRVLSHPKKETLYRIEIQKDIIKNKKTKKKKINHDVYFSSIEKGKKFQQTIKDIKKNNYPSFQIKIISSKKKTIRGLIIVETKGFQIIKKNSNNNDDDDEKKFYKIQNLRMLRHNLKKKRIQLIENEEKMMIQCANEEDADFIIQYYNKQHKNIQKKIKRLSSFDNPNKIKKHIQKIEKKK
ncbi:nnp-1 protein putative nuclear protein 1 nop52 [Anaeramoeba flamelloides]|uniref:Nnp-1 protein putative nuclear protein 1 nop52 n=1 Tax=Anaeramoeba flamelloides TaxID=1746091 RepID=A0AAV7ZQR4_9EUKA|nr:nnp-1 protein putative nuclear protein 1 nop52 [Anaeramoeba flamelloides]